MERVFYVLDPVYFLPCSYSVWGGLCDTCLGKFYRGKGESIVSLNFFPYLLHHVSFHLIKSGIQGHHMHCKIGREREHE